jgi:hypothetical protein
MATYPSALKWMDRLNSKRAARFRSLRNDSRRQFKVFNGRIRSSQNARSCVSFPIHPAAEVRTDISGWQPTIRTDHRSPTTHVDGDKRLFWRHWNQWPGWIPAARLWCRMSRTVPTPSELERCLRIAIFQISARAASAFTTAVLLSVLALQNRWT